jgi:hypothetical protein
MRELGLVVQTYEIFVAERRAALESHAGDRMGLARHLAGYRIRLLARLRGAEAG